MALRQLRIEGDPLLRKTSKPVRAVTPRIQQILSDMAETMYESQGVGLAAPQVGLLKRMVTIDVGEGLYKMINPEIVAQSEEKDCDLEGCLSIPSFNGIVSRPAWIDVRYMDETGQEKTLRADGLFARCICHEIDHLDGVLFRDRTEREIDVEHLTEEDRQVLEDIGYFDDARRNRANQEAEEGQE